MFSAAGTSAVTRSGRSSAGNTLIAPSTAAPPLMSVFIAIMTSAVFSDRPPESKVMPLPTSTTWQRGSADAYVTSISRGGRADPAPTARMPPKPSAASSRRPRSRRRRRPPTGARPRPRPGPRCRSGRPARAPDGARSGTPRAAALRHARGLRLGHCPRPAPCPAPIGGGPAEPVRRRPGAAPSANRPRCRPAAAAPSDRHLEREQAKGKPGEVTAVPLAGAGRTELLLLAGIGDGSPTALRQAGAALARRARRRAALGTALAWGSEPVAVRAHVEGLLLGAYRFERRRVPEPAVLTDIEVLVADVAVARSAVDAGVATAAAGTLARELANTPSLEKSPKWLAKQAEVLGRRAGLDVRVRGRRELAAEGFGGILAVGAGSADAYVTSISRGGRADPRCHVVLVGKGITCL